MDAPESSQGGERYELTLRGFSPRELSARAEQQCASRFGAGRFRLELAQCVPCVCSLGGRVRLYEAHIVAHPAPASPA